MCNMSSHCNALVSPCETTKNIIKYTIIRPIGGISVKIQYNAYAETYRNSGFVKVRVFNPHKSLINTEKLL